MCNTHLYSVNYPEAKCLKVPLLHEHTHVLMQATADFSKRLADDLIVYIKHLQNTAASFQAHIKSIQRPQKSTSRYSVGHPRYSVDCSGYSFGHARYGVRHAGYNCGGSGYKVDGSGYGVEHARYNCGHSRYNCGHSRYNCHHSGYGVGHCRYKVGHSRYNCHHSGYNCGHSRYNCRHCRYKVEHSGYGVRHARYNCGHSRYSVEHAGYNCRHSGYNFDHTRYGVGHARYNFLSFSYKNLNLSDNYLYKSHRVFEYFIGVKEKIYGGIGSFYNLKPLSYVKFTLNPQNPEQGLLQKILNRLQALITTLSERCAHLQDKSLLTPAPEMPTPLHAQSFNILPQSFNKKPAGMAKIRQTHLLIPLARSDITIVCGCMARRMMQMIPICDTAASACTNL